MVFMTSNSTDDDFDSKVTEINGYIKELNKRIELTNIKLTGMRIDEKLDTLEDEILAKEEFEEEALRENEQEIIKEHNEEENTVNPAKEVFEKAKRGYEKKQKWKISDPFEEIINDYVER